MCLTADKDRAVLRVTPQEPGDLMERLDSAIRSVELAAIQEGKHGVLVTRHADFSYSVTLSPDVPYGVTQEHQC